MVRPLTAIPGILLFLLPVIASAKTIATYRMQITPAGDPDSSKMDWFCLSHQTVHGLYPLKPGEHKYKQGSFVQIDVPGPLARGLAPLTRTFTRDTEEPALLQQVTLDEQCRITGEVTETVYAPSTTTINPGGTVLNEFQTRTRRVAENKSFEWLCSAMELPTRVGASSRTVSCESAGDSRTTRTFKANIVLLKIEEVFAKSVGCKGKDDNRVILSLRECPGSNAGARKPKFKVKLGAEPEFEFQSSSDPLHEDFEYCGASKDIVRMKLTPLSGVALPGQGDDPPEIPSLEFERSPRHQDLRDSTLEIEASGQSGPPLGEGACLKVSMRESPLIPPPPQSGATCLGSAAASPITDVAADNVRSSKPVIEQVLRKPPQKKRK
jgi:hypothetical protein